MFGAFLVAQMVKHLPAMWGTWVQPLGWEDPLKKEMATQYSCLENPVDGGAWWAVVPGVAKSWTRLSNFAFTFHFHALEKEMATHSSILPGESQEWGSLVGCCLWSCTESDMTEAT